MNGPIIDPHSGEETTGHEWNGITELNTPVPKPAWIAYGVFTLAAIVLWILYPTFPLGDTYTKGVLGADQQASVEQQLSRVRRMRADRETEIATRPFQSLQADRAVMEYVRNAGGRLFADNCALCHGPSGQGSRGFPDLTDDQWLWGGSSEQIMETLRTGINTEHSETRISEMLAFGRLDMLTYEERLDLTNFVHSLSNGGISPSVLRGAAMFETQCSACHGADGTGVQAVGGPNLTDDAWIYGGEIGDIQLTLRDGRKGVMPSWEDRLSETERKILTLYVLDLGEGEQ